MNCEFGHENDIEYYNYDTQERQKFKCDKHPYQSSKYCVYHNQYSYDGKKQKGLIETIQTAVNATLDQNSYKYFLGWRFQFYLSLNDKVFNNPTSFAYAQFFERVNFSNTVFYGRTDFSYTIFQDEADFSNAIFYEYVNFEHSIFNGKVNFANCKFMKGAVFSASKFEKKTSFQNTHFEDYGNFSGGVLFEGETTFQQTIAKSLTFFAAKFICKPNFVWIACGDLDFSESNILDGLDLYDSKINGDIIFRSSDIKGQIHLSLTKLSNGHLSIERCSFESIYAESMECRASVIEFRDCRIAFLSLHSSKFDKCTVEFIKITSLDNNEFRGLRSINNSKFFFKECRFKKDTFFDYSVFEFCRFSNIYFEGKVDFIESEFPEIDISETDKIKINFEYSSFGDRVRLKGKSDKLLNLETVSFKGVDLSNAEFHNVRWINKEEKYLPVILVDKISQSWKNIYFLGPLKSKFRAAQNSKFIKTLQSTSRSVIVDELELETNHNYNEVSNIYYQLRKNFETKLQYSDASHFFLGEMETRRKMIKRFKGYLNTLPFVFYKHLSFYGENIVLPLCLYTPLVIFCFTFIYAAYYPCNIHTEDCTLIGDIGRSLSSYFQINSSSNIINVLERLLAIPILATLFIGLKRRLERQK